MTGAGWRARAWCVGSRCRPLRQAFLARDEATDALGEEARLVAGPATSQRCEIFAGAVRPAVSGIE
jgi:hypothetical protein